MLMNLNELKEMKRLLGEPFDMELFTEGIYCIGEAE